MKDLFKEAALKGAEPYSPPNKVSWHRKARRALKRLLRIEVEIDGTGRYKCMQCKQILPDSQFTINEEHDYCNSCYAWLINDLD